MLSKFAKSNLYFQYNTAFLGTNIAATNFLQLAKGTILNNPNYTLQVVDDAPDRVKIVVDKLTDNDLYLLSTTAEQLAHAKINISQLSQSPDIVFDEGRMQGESFFYNTATQQQIAYPYVFADDAIRQEILAKPVITGFNPKQLRAGTRDTLTITGMNFGTTKGKIWFPNSDTAYLKYIEVLNDPDILSWTNTQIKTLVPSYTNMDKSCAGSGRFIVQAASSVLDTMKSIDSLEIIYAIENYRSALSSAPYRMNLVDTNRQGGLTFRYHPNFSSKPKAALCFGETLKKWRCATGVNFIVGKDTAIATIAGDGVNVVNFASASDFASLGLSELLDETHAYKNCQTVLKIDSIREYNKGTELHKETETRYYISDLDKNAPEFNGLVRGHWGIENNLHWALDVVFHEDNSRVLKGNAPENLNTLRKIALEILTHSPDKDSLKVRRKKSGWDDKYAFELIHNFINKDVSPIVIESS